LRGGALSAVEMSEAIQKIKNVLFYINTNKVRVVPLYALSNIREDFAIRHQCGVTKRLFTAIFQKTKKMLINSQLFITFAPSI
jgi:hypothetical protein